MTEDIKKAIEAGKLTQSAGTALERLAPGTYVLHKSWGYGAIASHDFMLGNTIIDFRNKKGHPMKFEYAAESLTPLADDHIAARKYRDMDGVRKLAQSDPAALVRIVLGCLGGRASQEQLTAQLVPDVFAEPAFKKWWESAKRALKADPLVGVPQKKNEHFILRLEALSQTDELVAGFRNARTLKDQILGLDNLTKSLAAFTDPSVLVPIVSAIEDAAKKAVKLQTSEALQLIVVRDEIVGRFPAISASADAPTVAGIFRDEETKLSTLLGELPVSKLKKAILALPEAFGEHWAPKAVSIFMRGNSKVVPEAARLLVEKGMTAEFGVALDRAIRDQSITAEGVHWLCEERSGVFSEVALTPRTLSAALGAMERDQFKEKRDRRLHDLLMNDKQLVLDLIESAEADELREAMRKLIMTPVFEELNKRSLLGRIVRIYPELEEIITGRDEKPKTELVVSWESLERRKAELDVLVNKKIPQNRQDIQIARDYGDLRENFEYKSAKEQQRVLTRQKIELERDLARARGTDFRDTKTDVVGIGTTVVIKRMKDSVQETYTILGAWDTDPTKHIISYLSQMAQALIGRAVGDRVSAPTETGEHEVEVVSIQVATR